MNSPDDKGSWLSFTAGLPKPEDQGLNPLRLLLQIHAGVEPDNMMWHLYPMPDKKDNVSGNYYVRNLPNMTSQPMRST